MWVAVTASPQTPVPVAMNAWLTALPSMFARPIEVPLSPTQ
jgi:hypothetical protein